MNGAAGMKSGGRRIIGASTAMKVSARYAEYAASITGVVSDARLDNHQRHTNTRSRFRVQVSGSCAENCRFPRRPEEDLARGVRTLTSLKVSTLKTQSQTHTMLLRLETSDLEIFRRVRKRKGHLPLWQGALSVSLVREG